MTAYEKIWDYAENNHGIITTAQAKKLGVDKGALPAMAQRGTLIRLGHGVYQVKHHVPTEQDVYAVGVALAGPTAYLRGASVVALLGLAPTNPSVLYLGAKGRVRRKLPTKYEVVDMRPVETVDFYGIQCQRVEDALKTALAEGEMDAYRVEQATEAAREKGLING